MNINEFQGDLTDISSLYKTTDAICFWDKPWFRSKWFFLHRADGPDKQGDRTQVCYPRNHQGHGEKQVCGEQKESENLGAP